MPRMNRSQPAPAAGLFMKTWRQRITIAALCAAVSTNSGCEQRSDISTYAADQHGHRLVRISFANGKGSFRIRVNEGPIEKIPNTSFTNIMARFAFEYGDIMVWEAVRDSNGKELTWP